MEQSTVALIPVTAWEQVVIICLFVVLIIVVGSFLVKMLTSQRKTISGDTKNQLQTMEDLLTLITNFIAARDTQWQNWIEKQDKRNCQSMSDISDRVDNSLTEMSRAVAKVVDALAALTVEVRQLDAKIQVEKKDPPT